MDKYLRAFTTDAAGEMDVFGHNGDTFGVDGAQVGILKQANQVSLGSFLECHDCRALETEIGLEILGDFANETLERKLGRKVERVNIINETKEQQKYTYLAQQKLSGLLKLANFTKSHGARTEYVGLLDAARHGGCRFASGLAGQLLARGLRITRFNECIKEAFEKFKSTSPCHRWTCGRFASCGPLD